MHLPKSRWSAFIIQLGLSIVIYAAVSFVVVFLLYPGALFPAAGGLQGLRIALGVDFIIGPLLTLAVYNLAKPRNDLYQDLTVLTIVRVVCLFIGLFLLYHQRPVAVTYAYDRFYTLQRSEFVVAKSELKKLDFNVMKPRFYYVDLPEDDAEAEVKIRMLGMTGKPPVLRTELYRDFPGSEEEGVRVLHTYESPYPEHQNCTAVRIRTGFVGGVACFDIKTHRLDRFVAEQETVTRDPSQIR